jgi:hypothetical protein
MFTWDEVINRYEILYKGARGYERSKLAGCMLQILPSLRQAVEERFPGACLSLVMLAVELRLPSASHAVVIQAVDECRFVVRTKDEKYEVLEESEADLSNVIEQTIRYLEDQDADNIE